MHYSTVKTSCSNFRMITANYLGVQIFRIFTILHTLQSKFLKFICQKMLICICGCCFCMLNYRKIPKYLDTRKIAVIILKFEQGGFNCRVMCPSEADGMANSVDPDLGLHCLTRPDCPKISEYYGKRGITHEVFLSSNVFSWNMSPVMRKPVYAICEQQRR